jgi:diguanylate cyclase (GGDEF)-like protein
MEKKKHSILVVDDQETNITMLEKILIPEYIIHAANSGEEAVKMALKLIPDMILLDVVMDGIGGYDVIKILKDSEKTKDIPVIFVTSLDSIGDEAWGLSLGAADYITKPLSPAIVKLRVANLLNARDQLRTIERLLTHDPLTDLPNRRSLIHRVKADWEKTLKKNKPFSILIIDVDEFTSYNNIFGHEQGDAALQQISGVLGDALKNPSDFVGRWGGGEFIMLMPDVEVEEALEAAEYIRKNIEESEISIPDGRAARLTVSIGMNTHQEWWDGATSDEFIKEAYSQLFEAKDNGGNQVCHIQKERHNSI